MSYGSNVPASFLRAATYADKILKGAKPAALPVEHPPKVDLLSNLKTTKALGLTIPQSLLLRADQVMAHSSVFQSIPAHDAVGSFSSIGICAAERRLSRQTRFGDEYFVRHPCHRLRFVLGPSRRSSPRWWLGLRLSSEPLRQAPNRLAG